MIAKEYCADKIFQELLDEVVESAKLNGTIAPEIWTFLQLIADELPPYFLANLLAIVDGRQGMAA